MQPLLNFIIEFPKGLGILIWVCVGISNAFVTTYIHTCMEEDLADLSRLLKWGCLTVPLGILGLAMVVAFVLLSLSVLALVTVLDKAEGVKLFDRRQRVDRKE